MGSKTYELRDIVLDNMPTVTDWSRPDNDRLSTVVVKDILPGLSVWFSYGIPIAFVGVVTGTLYMLDIPLGSNLRTKTTMTHVNRVRLQLMSEPKQIKLLDEKQFRNVYLDSIRCALAEADDQNEKEWMNAHE